MENGNPEIPENANEHCPGTQSESAGKSDACEGCPNQQICATAPKGPDPAALFIPANKPREPDHKVLTASKQRKKRNRERRDEEERTGVGLPGGCKKLMTRDSPFPFIGENILDSQKRPLLKWDPKGFHVNVSTYLPSWKESDRISGAAFAVTSTLYGRDTLRELDQIAPTDIPKLAAQAQLRSVTLNHHMGLQLGHAQKRIERMKKIIKGSYSPDNRRFKKRLIRHGKDSIEEALDIMRSRGMLKDEFNNVTFAGLYPRYDTLVISESEEDESPGRSSDEEE